jgi:aryl-alcohol dehydrogenase-like predicted oxidoreductase
LTHPIARHLGTTGLTVTPVGLGLAALGRPAYVTLGRRADVGSDRSVGAMERRCHEMLDAAWAQGIRYVDAARSYGRAEAFLASWLKAYGPERPITIGSKWGYTYTGEWQMDAAVHETKDLSLATLRKQLAETRSLLGQRLGLYQIHSATLESGVLDDPGVLNELARLRSEGLVIGLTVTGAQQADTIRTALDVRIDGVNPFQCVQATWNLLEPSAGPALGDAHASGWGVIVKEAFANGRLTDRYEGPETHDVRTLAASGNVTVATLAFSAALAQPWADVVLTGAVTPQQLDENLSALSANPVNEIDTSRFAESAEAYWERRRQLPWT